jgi:pimeloyl-ACP methyl ester carboxylesterase
MASQRVCGHSYGGWIALTYALHAPHRVSRLALLDPTSCFAGMSPRYLLHATPLLVRPAAARMRAFLRWEIGGLPVDPGWLEVAALAAGLPRPRIVMPRRPRPADLRSATVPTLVLLAEQSRSHDIRRVDAAARRLMPAATTAILPGVSHHSLPTGNPDGLSRELLRFLAPSR